MSHNSTVFYNKNMIKDLLFPEISNSPSPLGIEKNKIKVYPSITSGNLHIEITNNNFNEKPKIIDIFGREVKNFKIIFNSRDRFLIDTSSIPEGLYFIFFNTFGNSNDKMRKFIIRK